MRLSDPASPLRLVRPRPDEVRLREARCALESHVFRGNNFAKLIAVASVLGDPERRRAHGVPEREVVDQRAARDLIELLAKLARCRYASDMAGWTDCMARLDDFLTLASALREAAVGGHA